MWHVWISSGKCFTDNLRCLVRHFSILFYLLVFDDASLIFSGVSFHHFLKIKNYRFQVCASPIFSVASSIFEQIWSIFSEWYIIDFHWCLSLIFSEASPTFSVASTSLSVLFYQSVSSDDSLILSEISLIFHSIDRSSISFQWSSTNFFLYAAIFTKFLWF